MDKSLMSAKNMSMYLSTNPSAYEIHIHKHIPCDIMYIVEFRGKTLYCSIHKNPAKAHRTIDTALKMVEADIDPSGTVDIFECISNVLSGKVKTFTAGQQASDEMYNAIFTRTTMGCKGERKIHPNVRIWHPPINTAEESCEEQPRVRKQKRVSSDDESHEEQPKMRKQKRTATAEDRSPTESELIICELNATNQKLNAKVAELESIQTSGEILPRELKDKMQEDITQLNAQLETMKDAAYEDLKTNINLKAKLDVAEQRIAAEEEPLLFTESALLEREAEKNKALRWQVAELKLRDSRTFVDKDNEASRKRIADLNSKRIEQHNQSYNDRTTIMIRDEEIYKLKALHKASEARNQELQTKIEEDAAKAKADLDAERDGIREFRKAAYDKIREQKAQITQHASVTAELAETITELASVKAQLANARLAAK